MMFRRAFNQDVSKRICWHKTLDRAIRTPARRRYAKQSSGGPKAAASLK
jgi:hypothetical protein